MERDWIVVCLVTETGPDALGVSGSMGTAVRPIMFRQRERDIKGMISRRPRPGRISPPKAVVTLTQGDGR